MNLQQSKHALKVRMNYEVTTSTGHKWVAILTGWRDTTSGLVWKHEDEPGTFVFDDAVAKFGDSLPSKEEYEEAEKHGVREVLDLQSDYYWSASVFSFTRSSAWYFNFFTGTVSSFNRFITFSVRCVGR